ncbi:hypothetical protein A0J61_04734 [Choanephora cucurbitarum]|uniref:RING finger protein B n=1 Tax=Choanephora cucurbitarum TaxID=101091 RepID=A0A1C7NF88_9FUNG|nr:hypothetical protein A0J61_04734 [Choanephora cucurbitarum]
MNKDSSLTYFHYGISSAVLNNTLYLFGKRGNRRLLNNDNEGKIWSAETKDIQYSTSAFTQFRNLNFTNTIPKEPSFSYTPVISLEESNRILIFTKTWSARNKSIFLTNKTASLSLNQQFNLLQLTPNATLSPVATKPNSKVPLYRQETSLTLSLPSQQYVYLLGGVNDVSVQKDFWMYSIQKSEWTKLRAPQTNRCGHTTSMLSDGRLIVIGGYRCLDPLLNDQDYEMRKNIDLSLIEMGTIDVFNTNTSTWMQQNQTKGDLPSPRVFHSAIVASQNQKMSPFQSYIGSSLEDRNQMSAILDTNSWTWRIPSQSPYQPYPQSHGILSIINKSKIAYGLGENYYTTYHSLHVFDAEIESWEYVQSTTISSDRILDKQIDTNSPSSLKWIIVSCVLSGFLLAYIVGVCIIGFYKFNLKIIHACEGVRRRFWKPRIGEPKWAEATRLLLKSVFLGFLAYLIYVFVRQIIDSPAIDQVFFVSNKQATVDAPDIKFCFEEWNQPNPPFIRCSTDIGISCSDYLQQLPTETNKGGIQLTCTTFQPPPDFQLGQSSSEANGTFLKFDYYYTQNLTQQGSQQHELQLTLSNRLARQKAQTEPVHHLNTQVMSTVSYELIRHEFLENKTWNYIGIAPSFTVHHQIQTMIQSETHAFSYESSVLQRQPFGSLHVLPSHDQTKVIHEQKSFAVINAIGILGGLFGLLFSLQTCLFGYRPQSPWGYLHRWSFGHFRLSLMNGLHTNFYTSSKRKSTLSLPVIVPPQSRSSRVGQDSLLFPSDTSPSLNNQIGDLRLSMVEEKVHLLERLFQAYYIDDEVFRSLDQALRQADESTNLPLVTPSDPLSYSPVPEKRKKEHRVI